jgi:hypothetical protein
MNYHLLIAKNLVQLLAVAIFSLCLTETAAAQGKPAGLGPPPDNNPNLADRARQVAEGRLRSAEVDAGTDEKNQKLVQAAIANMKEDFKRIQVLRNDIARNLVARKPLDYQLISEQTAEINKRASRLNLYMQAHDAGGEKENDSDELKDGEIVGALVRLCKLIDSFTENPALKNAATVDAKDVAKAKENKANADRDLLAIVKLSNRLRKESEKLKVAQ